MCIPSAQVLEHVRFPRNGHILDDANGVGRASWKGRAPYVTIYLSVDECSVVTQCTFQVSGCGFSIACCSVLTELARGRSVSDCSCIEPSDVERALDGLPNDKRFCATLAVCTLRAALMEWAARNDHV